MKAKSIGYKLDNGHQLTAEEARLVRSAPELLEALKFIHELLCDAELCGHYTAEEIRGITGPAIAKATGGKP